MTRPLSSFIRYTPGVFGRVLAFSLSRLRRSSMTSVSVIRSTNVNCWGGGGEMPPGSQCSHARAKVSFWKKEIRHDPHVVPPPRRPPVPFGARPTDLLSESLVGLLHTHAARD